MYAYCMADIFDFDGAYREIGYFSYTQDLAAEHTRKIKQYIMVNPYFDLQDVSSAETVLDCRNSYGQKILLYPQGILSFKRGRHPHIVILDDPLKDPQVALDLKQIEKVTTAFREEIMPMPKEGGELHIVGTSQDPTDLFWQTKKMKRFDWAMYPAIKEDGSALWPEVFPLERLAQEREDMLERAFRKEYLLDPVRRAEGYFTEPEINAVINHGLKNRSVQSTDNPVYAGLDIGKKRHPSHLSVFMDMDGKLIQIHSGWLDNADYIDQREYCRTKIDGLQIDTLEYDNTRGEFESFKEEGTLPEQMEGVTFTRNQNWKMAEQFGREVARKTIQLLPEERQKRSILSVGNDLKAPESPEGHGDAFWSIALAVDAARGRAPVEIIDIGG